jgi:surface antigen
LKKLSDWDKSFVHDKINFHFTNFSQMRKPLILVLCMLVLNGCQSTNSERGALLGAVAGGILGNQVGGGSGNDIATVVGFLGGAMIGGSIGTRMDDVDRMKMAQAQHESLENGRSGDQTTWTNPDTGHSGSISPLSTNQTSDGKYCREFQQEVVIGGETEQAFGTACRQPDGSWKILGG